MTYLGLRPGEKLFEELLMAEPPVLSADAEKFSASIKADEKKLISGVTAFDQKDGDVSDSILIDSIKKKEGTDSDFLITYVAFDKSSNMA